MIRLFRYLKPYLPAVLLSILLLFGQANADLALPDFMSRIVNVGIQQGGIETAVPEAIRASTMENLLRIIPVSSHTTVLEAYRLVSPSAPESAAYRDRYPAAETEAIYVLESDDPATTESLGSLLGPALVASMRLGPMMDLSSLPDLSGGATLEMFNLESSMLVQAAAVPIKAEYTALGMNTNRIQSMYILRTGAAMLLLTLGSAVATILVGLLSARIAAGFSRDVRLAVFERVESFSAAEIDRFSTASLITRSTNDITQIQMVVVMTVRMVFYAPLIGVGGVIRAVGKSSSMWWVIAVAVGALSVLVVTVYFIAVPKFKLVQKLTDRLNLVSRETLSGMMVIRAFSMQKHEEDRFDGVNTDLTNTSLFVNRVMVVLMPVMMLIMNGLSVLVIWVGAQQIAASAMQIGDMMAFLQYTMQIVFAFLMLSFMFIMLPRAAVSAGRIADVLETEPGVKDPESPRAFGDVRGTVEFRGVGFRYPNAEEDVLHDISFTAKPGSTTAVIGATGSGKSTIVNLIPRFYDVTAGSILVDGVDIREVTQHDLRSQIGYVPQKSTLFTGTIESNLRIGDEGAADDALRTAVATAQATDFVSERPEGYQAEIAQAGANVSGGQKQRLSIARALVGRPPIYLFDDSFSALDFKTDSALRRALGETAGESTRIVVTQRVASVKSADQIIVLDAGRIVGKGTHRELMDTCETYREIALSQLSEEELS